MLWFDFGRRHREAAQRALDEQRDLERKARAELAELALAQHFTADEIAAIRRYRASKARFDCLGVTNANGRTEAESILLSVEYQNATREYMESTREFFEIAERHRGSLNPLTN